MASADGSMFYSAPLPANKAGKVSISLYVSFFILVTGDEVSPSISFVGPVDPPILGRACRLLMPSGQPFYPAATIERRLERLRSLLGRSRAAREPPR